MLCLVAVLTGCDRGPAQNEAPASGVSPSAKPGVIDRMQDPVYTNALVQSRKAQVGLAKRVEPVVRQMESMKAKARTALPKDATEAQVLEELDLHPAKYPGWRELKVRAVELEANLKQEQKAARDLIRARIERERADKKAAN